MLNHLEPCSTILNHVEACPTFHGPCAFINWHMTTIANRQDKTWHAHGLGAGGPNFGAGHGMAWHGMAGPSLFPIKHEHCQWEGSDPGAQLTIACHCHCHLPEMPKRPSLLFSVPQQHGHISRRYLTSSTSQTAQLDLQGSLEMFSNPTG